MGQTVPFRRWTFGRGFLGAITVRYEAARLPCLRRCSISDLEVEHVAHRAPGEPTTQVVVEQAEEGDFVVIDDGRSVRRDV